MADENESPSGEQTIPASGREGSVEPSSESVLSTDAQAQKRYELGEVLGEGGMGIVYEAFDRQLKRTVAIKLLRSDDRASVDRFLREARSQARVEHTNICKVFEVGRLGGRPFIAMQRVRGAPCADAAAEMTVEQKARLLRDVAEAVQAAHAVGLIHRDIKPSNILLEQTDDVEWIPFVTDFGIARDPQAPGLTAHGEALGSPAYMAPEQAMGDTGRMDRRTDVYGLGATLFELLTGRPPFEGQSALDVMRKVVDEEPPGVVTLRPGVPADLATVVHKCLDKDPARRYQSAHALAEDLDRFLAGEPVDAKRTGLVGRVTRRVRRHRVASALLAFAALVILVLTAYLVRSARLSSQREEYARQFGQEAERVESMIRVASLMPLHDTQAERRAARHVVDDLVARLPLLPGGGRAAAQFAIGRGLLALQEPSEALPHLRAAWDGGFQRPEAAFALGRALGDVFQKELAASRRIGDEAQKKARVAELRARYRDPAVELLGRARAMPQAAPEYVLGMIAFQEGKLPRAAQLARRAFEKVPSMFEAKRLEGDVRQAAGFEEHVYGRSEDALKEYRGALDAYAKAAEIARSDPKILDAACSVRLRFLEISTAHGSDPEGPYADVVSACRAAAAADSGFARPWTTMALAGWKRGGSLHSQGKDPTAAFADSIAFAGEALKRDPRDAHANTWAGVALTYRAEFESETGRDPRRSREEALARYRRAAELDPQWSVTHNGVATTLLDRGYDEMARGLDPTATWEEAEKSALRGFALDPRYANALDVAGQSRFGRARFLRLRGIDSVALLESAEDAFQKAAAIKPTDDEVQIHLAQVRIERAERILAAGGDPTAEITDALRHADVAFKENPKASAVAYTRGEAAMLSARAAVRTGNAEPDFRAAAAQFEEALRLRPGNPDALARLAELRIEESKRRAGRAGRAGGGR